MGFKKKVYFITVNFLLIINLVEPASPTKEYVHSTVFVRVPLDDTCLLNTGNISASTGKDSSNMGCFDSAKHCTTSPDLDRNMNEPFLKLIASLIAEAPKTRNTHVQCHIFIYRVRMKTYYF